MGKGASSAGGVVDPDVHTAFGGAVFWGSMRVLPLPCLMKLRQDVVP